MMMTEATIARYLSRQCFMEAAYFGTIVALHKPSAFSHLLAGAACCGCTRPLAISQRILEGEPVAEVSLDPDALRIAPISELPYEGFFHLVEALRLDRALLAPAELREILDTIADDLVFVSRRELERAPGIGKRYTLTATSVAAAALLRRFTGSFAPLAGVPPYKLEYASEMIEQELTHKGGDAAFYTIAPLVTN